MGLVVFGLVLVESASIRFWAAPLSAGPDVAQFWAFARVFQQYGFDFYRYADASLGIFPFAGWAYVYPPVWLVVLRLSLLAAPGSLATDSMVDVAWRVAAKTPIIAADLAIGVLLFWAIPGSKLRKTLFASLWLFNPTAWYESAVFGQFDAIAAAFLLASLILLGRKNDRLSFLFAALAVMTKQHTIIPVVLMLLASAHDLGKRRLVGDCAIFGAVLVFLSLPFLVTGNLLPYFRSLLLAGWSPDYQPFLVYVFSGSTSLLTYLHNTLGWETRSLMNLNMPLLVVALFIAGSVIYKKKLAPMRAALVGYLLFIALSYQVNYQYLVVYMPIAILLAAQTPSKAERVLALALVILPAVWLWRFNTSFWFWYLSPLHYEVIPIFQHLHMDRGIPDYGYVIFALALMALCLGYVIFALVWKRHEEPTGT